MEDVESLRPQLDLSFRRAVSGRTYVDRRIFRWPFTVSRTFYLDEVPNDMATLILQTVSGSIITSDTLHQRIHVESGARAHITTQGATAVHRALPDSGSSEDVSLCVDRDGFVEYLPEPRILFPNSAFSQRIQVRTADDGVAILSDAFTIYDPQQQGLVFRHFVSELKIETLTGDALAFDRLDLREMPRQSGRLGAFAAFGSICIVTRLGSDRAWELCRAIAADSVDFDGLYASASPLPNDAGVNLRIAAWDGRALRAGLEAGWSAARRFFFGTGPGSSRRWIGRMRQ